MKLSFLAVHAEFSGLLGYSGRAMGGASSEKGENTTRKALTSFYFK